MTLFTSKKNFKASLGGLDPVDLVTQLALARTEIHRLQTELEQLRQLDPLTGLPNRSRLSDRMDQATLLALRQGHLVALLFIEVDRFKSINQNLEFSEADELWVQFSRRLAAPLRHPHYPPDMIDPFGRHISYLRVSVTDRCGSSR